MHRLLNEGARLLRAERAEEALAPLGRAYELAPDDPDVAMTYGGALIMNAKWSKAVAVLEKAVSQHPENARLWLNLAAAYLGRLKLSSRQAQERAIEAYERAIAIDPVAPSAHYNVGLIHAERKDWEQAEQWFQAALRANPADKDAAYWLERVRAARETDGKRSS
ncbi:MAG: tetratricopeptide repeat protein [Chloroflexi bacterium]|nr:tetratricopeptide repeat protein [Chloroflexota bacterium]